jgi:hypothetical protein
MVLVFAHELDFIAEVLIFIPDLCRDRSLSSITMERDLDGIQ